MLGPNEVIEDLQLDGLRIIRAQGGFTYGTDAVLLSSFARAKKSDRLLDLGTGTGILALLVHAKTGAHITAVDLNEALCSMAHRSVSLNALEGAIEVLCADIRALHTLLPLESFDGAVCNPPYFLGGTKSPLDQKRLSTHQDACSLFDVAFAAKKLIKNGGRLFLVYPAPSFGEACNALYENGFEVKRAQMLHAPRLKKPRLVLLEAKKGAKAGILWEAPLVLKADGTSSFL